MFQNEPIKIGANQYACPFCNKTMRMKFHMEAHICVHTGEKPFTCHICDYASPQKSNLKRHIMKMHQ